MRRGLRALLEVERGEEGERLEHLPGDSVDVVMFR